MPSVWLPEPAIGPGPRHAKSPLQPGSGGTEELTVSGEPGRCGATLGTHAVKSSRQELQIKQPNAVPACPVSHQTGNQTCNTPVAAGDRRRREQLTQARYGSDRAEDPGRATTLFLLNKTFASVTADPLGV